MHGVVTFDQLAWIVGLICVAGGAVAGFVFWVWRLVDSMTQKIHERDKQLREELQDHKTELEREVQEYKVYVAQNYATKDGVSSAVARLEQSVERLTTLIHEGLDRITQRMDRVLDQKK